MAAEGSVSQRGLMGLKPREPGFEHLLDGWLGPHVLGDIEEECLVWFVQLLEFGDQAARHGLFLLYDFEARGSQFLLHDF